MIMTRSFLGSLLKSCTSAATRIKLVSASAMTADASWKKNNAFAARAATRQLKKKCQERGMDTHWNYFWAPRNLRIASAWTRLFRREKFHFYLSSSSGAWLRTLGFYQSANKWMRRKAGIYVEVGLFFPAHVCLFFVIFFCVQALNDILSLAEFTEVIKFDYFEFITFLHLSTKYCSTQFFKGCRSWHVGTAIDLSLFTCRIKNGFRHAQ